MGEGRACVPSLPTPGEEERGLTPGTNFVMGNEATKGGGAA